MTTPGITSRSRVLALVLVAALSSTACTTTPGRLDIYFVDVEGGQATLIVAPTGETLLIDAGYPGQGKSDPIPGEAKSARDAQRIAAAAADANASQIDFLLVTHFHTDHFGGVMELAQLLPIGTIIDQGTEAREARSNPATLDLIRAYKAVRDQHRYLVPVVGDRLPLKDVEVTVVSSAGNVLASPIDGAGSENPACNRTAPMPSEAFENPRSTGILLRFGKFRFLNLGDLIGQPLWDLVCPVDRVGPVDAYLVPHHGREDAADPATFAAFRPRVAILNNGATKGGDALTFSVLRDAQGLDDVWQLHRSEVAPTSNFPAEYIANLGTETEHWIRLSAKDDGSFRIFNGRTGEWKHYEPGVMQE